MTRNDHLKLKQHRIAHLRQDRQRRIQLLIQRGWIRRASDIPEEMIPIDPNTSTKSTLLFPEIAYADIEFTCTKCGKVDNWWADDQAVYFEEMQSSPHKQPRLCYECREREVDRKEAARKDAGHGPYA